MNSIWGLRPDNPFTSLIGEPPASQLLSYVHKVWQFYAAVYCDSDPPLQKRNEAQLTQALAALLRHWHETGWQPFPGDFFGELSTWELAQNGMPKCVARTDIEWRLYGVAAFVVEFKLLDGKSKRRERYLTDGVSRFVSGQYARASYVGAMFALLRKGGIGDPDRIHSAVGAQARSLQCTAVSDESHLAPGLAKFDTSHERPPPLSSPFRLAHVFVPLPNSS